MKKLQLTKEMAAEIKTKLEEAVSEHCCGEFEGLVSESVYHNEDQCLVIWNYSEGLKVELMDTDEDDEEVVFEGEELDKLECQYEAIVSEINSECEESTRFYNELRSDSYAW
jgi:hypothetical protein